MARTPKKPPEDLAELDQDLQVQEQGIPIEIKSLDGESPLGFSILVAGPDSERAALAREAMQQELVARGTTDPLTPTESFDSTTRYLARVSIQFLGRAVLDKKPLEDTYEDFLRLYRRMRFIRDQVNRGSGRSSFFSKSGSDSSKQSVPAPETTEQA